MLGPEGQKELYRKKASARCIGWNVKHTRMWPNEHKSVHSHNKNALSSSWVCNAQVKCNEGNKNVSYYTYLWESRDVEATSRNSLKPKVLVRKPQQERTLMIAGILTMLQVLSELLNNTITWSQNRITTYKPKVWLNVHVVYSSVYSVNFWKKENGVKVSSEVCETI